MSRLLLIGKRSAPVEITQVGFVGSSSSTSHSISIVAGTAAPGRILACVLHFFGGKSTSPSITSASFNNGGPIPAVTPFPQIFDTGAALTGGDIGTAIVWAAVPTGNPVTLNLSFNTACSVNVGTYRVINAKSNAPVDSETLRITSRPGTASLFIDTLNNGGLVAGMSGYHLTSMGFVAGVTEDYNTNIIPSSSVWRAGGHHMTSTETRTVTVGNGGGSNMRGSMAAVSFR